jgi:N-methylhydantoinase A/oxoprolinase/acetone carboxylase beta subunit
MLNNPTKEELKHAITHPVTALTEEIEDKQRREISELKFEIQKLIDENLRVPGIVEKVSTTAPFKRLPEWVTWIHGDYNRRMRNIEVGLIDQISLIREDIIKTEESILEQVAQERESIMEVIGLDLAD